MKELSEAEVSLKLSAKIPTGCTGTWHAEIGDDIAPPNDLEARLRLREAEVKTVRRSFGLTCALSGNFSFGFLAEANALSGGSVISAQSVSSEVTVTVEPPYVPDELLVMFKPGTAESTIRQVISRNGTEIVQIFPSAEVQAAFPSAKVVYYLRITSNRSVPETVEIFALDAAVESAEPNYLGGIDDHQVHPNDPEFQNGNQWSLLNWGQPIRGAISLIDADTDAPQGWDLTRDCGKIVVAVADTGIDLAHLDLHNPGGGASNLWQNPGEIAGDGLDNDANGLIDDVFGADFIDMDGDPSDSLPAGHWARGHGTSVSGIIGAIGNNGLDVAGICWQAKILSLRIMPRDLTLPFAAGKKGWDLARFLATANYLALMKLRGENIKVLNLSGSMFYPGATPQASIALLDAADILLVTSAGNEPYDVDDNEDIYRDLDGSGSVSVGDIRLTEVTTPGLTFVAGTAVAAGDGDLLRPLAPFAADERHAENVAANGSYDPGEHLYRDNAPVGTVNGGATPDRRLTEVGAFLRGSNPVGVDPDIGTALVPFAANELHTEFDNPLPNGAYDHGARYPCTYTNGNVLCVGASDHRDGLADFSNYGVSSVDLLAPGVDTRALAMGGGTKWFDGTSASAPHVAGMAALCWSLPGLADFSDTRMKEQILRFVDRKPDFLGIVASGGRLRWPASAELGDAPNSYETTSLEPLLLCNQPGIHGALHWDYGNEWFGKEATTEHNANIDPVDQDAGSNIWKPATLPALCSAPPLPTNADTADDGGFIYAPPPPWLPGAVVTVRFRVCSDLLRDTNGDGTADRQFDDAAAGRYSPANPDKRIYANVFFDWNSDGDFADPGEHTPLAPNNVITEAELPVIAPPAAPPPPGCVTVTRTFVAVSPSPAWVRWRLDYGEDVGANVPALFLKDPGIPVGAHRDLAQFGEVEDYPLRSIKIFKFRWPWLNSRGPRDKPRGNLIVEAGAGLTLFQGESCSGTPLASARTNEFGYHDFIGLAEGVYSVQETPVDASAGPGECKTIWLSGPVAPDFQEYTSFPEAGTDAFDSGAWLELDIRGIRDRVTLNGPVVVRRGAPRVDPANRGLLTIETEMAVLELAGVSERLGIPVSVSLNPKRPSTGSIRQREKDAHFPAESRFHVFVEVRADLPEFGPVFLHHESPVSVAATIDRIPPVLTIYRPESMEEGVALLGRSGEEIGRMRHMVHIPLPPREMFMFFAE